MLAHDRKSAKARQPFLMRGKAIYKLLSLGGVAHLVERLNGIQEVRGSTPLISTKRIKRTLCPFFFYHLMRGAQLCCAQLCCSQTPTGWRSFACASTLISLLRHLCAYDPLISTIKRQADTNCLFFYL